MPIHCNNCSIREITERTIKIVDYVGDYEEFVIRSQLSQTTITLKRVELDSLYSILKTIYEH